MWDGDLWNYCNKQVRKKTSRLEGAFIKKTAINLFFCEREKQKEPYVSPVYAEEKNCGDFLRRSSSPPGKMTSVLTFVPILRLTYGKRNCIIRVEVGYKFFA